jgi:uncharacterized protein YcaQ
LIGAPFQSARLFRGASGLGYHRQPHEAAVTVLKLSNLTARRLWLSVNGLATPPTGAPETAELVRRLGFVQLDTIQIVSRAHHHILWSRDQTYREPMMDRMLGTERAVFEHFTHDASVIPIEFLPMWDRQFRRMKAKVGGSKWFGDALDPALLNDVKQRIHDEGPLSTRDFDTKIDGPRTVWQRPPHKKALDYLWYAGELATSHREGFTKFYDLADRVFPVKYRDQTLDDDIQFDLLSRAALDRIGVGTLTEIRKFWDATTAKETSHWASQMARDLVPVSVQSADGTWTNAVAPADIETRLAGFGPSTSRLRILNPFDPLIRDRTRLKRLFGFDYTVEMFVPAAKRKWGYYVYPILEGDRFIGRIEAKADRKSGTLTVLNLWAEPDVTFTKSRMTKLEAELNRFAKLATVENVLPFAAPS